MADQEKLPNWIERRAHRENLLRTGSGEAWSRVRAAIQDACESFNDLYVTERPAKCKLENGHRIVISRLVPADRRFADRDLRVIVGYVSGTATIEVAFDEPSGSRTFQITSDDNGVFILDGNRQITPDEVSEKILNSLLFAPPAIADDSEDS